MTSQCLSSPFVNYSKLRDNLEKVINIMAVYLNLKSYEQIISIYLVSFTCIIYIYELF